MSDYESRAILDGKKQLSNLCNRILGVEKLQHEKDLKEDLINFSMTNEIHWVLDGSFGYEYLAMFKHDYTYATQKKAAIKRIAIAACSIAILTRYDSLNQRKLVQILKESGKMDILTNDIIDYINDFSFEIWGIEK